MASLMDGAGANSSAPAANDDTAPNEATPHDQAAPSGAAAKAPSHRDVACVVCGLDATLPVRHEEVQIAGPLIEAVIEKLKALAANDNEESP